MAQQSRPNTAAEAIAMGVELEVVEYGLEAEPAGGEVITQSLAEGSLCWIGPCLGLTGKRPARFILNGACVQRGTIYDPVCKDIS